MPSTPYFFHTPLRYIVSFSFSLMLLVMVVGPQSLFISQAQATPIQPPVPASSEEVNGTYTGDWMVQVAPATDVNALATRMGFRNLGPLGSLPNYYLFRPLKATRSVDRSRKVLAKAPEVVQASPDRVFEVTERTVPPITDPLYPEQWHLKNTGQQAGGIAGNDANVYPAWDQGYTGTGVVLASVDDGLWWNSPDLSSNYLASASWDFVDNDFDVRHSNHGTRAGGVMAGVRNTAPNTANDCGVGVAFGASLGGIRVVNTLGDLPQVALARIAAGLNYKNNVIAVYNNSWGPKDDGKTLDGPDATIKNVLQNAILTGRGGKGNIFVWSAGNGGSLDNTNADGYVASIYTIGVGGSTASGDLPSYGEPGASILVNAPTDNIRTTAGNGASGCISTFNGTSASAAVVSGVVGLMLQANPNLTWRDVQHILVNTATKNDPTDPGWSTNAAGYPISHDYGFGRVNASAATSLAATWSNVPAQTSTAGSSTPNVAIPDNNPTGVSSVINIASNLVVEHVTIAVTIPHASRGQVEIRLTSPSGTVSRMMYGRTGDTSNAGYNNTTMMTIRNWGEMSTGNWTLTVIDTAAGSTGTLSSWSLTVYGYNGTPVKTNTPTFTPIFTSTPTNTPTDTATPINTATPSPTPVLGAFNLLTPANNVVMAAQGEITTMTWEASADANLYRLTLEPGGVNLTFFSSGDAALVCDTSVCILSLESAGIDLALFGGTNTWSVTAINDLGERAAENAPFNFTVSIPTDTDEPTITPTPTRTHTPTSTGTITATDNPAGTDTPTATMTAAVTELLINGSFDDDTDSDKVPDDWTDKNLTKDKLKCNKPDKIVAYDGACMFQFVGGTGENSKLSQSVDSAKLTLLEAGDVLNLTGYIKASGNVSAKVKVVVSYVDTSLPNGKLSVKRNSPNAEWETLADILQLNLADEPVSIKIIIQNKSASGKVRLDAFRLWLPATSLIRLPDQE